MYIFSIPSWSRPIVIKCSTCMSSLSINMCAKMFLTNKYKFILSWALYSLSFTSKTTTSIANLSSTQCGMGPPRRRFGEGQLLDETSYSYTLALRSLLGNHFHPQTNHVGCHEGNNNEFLYPPSLSLLCFLLYLYPSPNIEPQSYSNLICPYAWALTLY